ncbi:hypothetical protein [Pseudonocardia alni]|uniref:linalool dehydratase/isomerase domain-containing protein n=1 Tax=Pseudonocardia alni TaxID=33907 RepID=UPI001AD66414|nr:hypothetical protein [Pseudonocardia alni]
MSHGILTREQLGHLRHWDNLSRQLPNDWSLMHGKGVSQDDFGGYRFQLAYMVYGLALTHRHRLPAAPGLFAPTIRRLVEKLLQPEVWLYWRDVSRGGSVFNAHLSDGYTEQWDPVVRDNIMYSAYVQSCATLHDQLFGSDHFAAPGALTFRHWSFFWGGEEKRFAYDRDSLTEHLYWLMVESGYLGVACEPNCVFQICNQPAILGFRLHDQITGGSRAEEVVAGYEKAWADFGRLDEGGHYAMMISEDTREVRPNDLPSPWADAWCGALMNTWNGDFVRRHYRRQVADFLEPGPDGTFSVPSAPARQVMGQEIVSDTCDFGWVAAWASEMGDRETLAGLLAHADRFMAPTERDGGLYYPRNDTPRDADGRRTEIEPMTGNVLLGYARLNVEDGLRGLYRDPWPAGHHDAPRLSEVERDVEVSRAEVVDGVLHARLRRDRSVPGGGTVTLAGLAPGTRLRLDGTEVTPRTPAVLAVPDGAAVDLVAAP